MTEAARLIARHSVRRVLVVDRSRADAQFPLACFVGIVSDTDIFAVLSPGRGQGGPAAGGGEGEILDMKYEPACIICITFM